MLKHLINKIFGIRINKFIVKAIPLYFEIQDISLTLNRQQKIDWGHKVLNVENSHRRTLGDSIKIAYLDTGYSPHDDLEENFCMKESFVPNYGGNDKNGHGTFSQGIGSAVDNNIGVIGVAPKSLIFSGKVLDDTGSGNLDWLVEGINWAIEKDVDIINMSLGWLGSSYYPVHKVIKKAYKKGIILVAAAGNEGREEGNTINYPAKYKEVIAVGAINHRKRISNFSSRGPEVEISAPGENVTSTWKDNSYATLNGTSFASPFVAGIIALMLAKESLSPQQVRDKLKSTAIEGGKPGRDSNYGYGIINPPKVAQNRGLDLNVLV